MKPFAQLLLLLALVARAAGGGWMDGATARQESRRLRRWLDENVSMLEGERDSACPAMGRSAGIVERMASSSCWASRGPAGWQWQPGIRAASESRI